MLTEFDDDEKRPPTKRVVKFGVGDPVPLDAHFIAMLVEQSPGSPFPKVVLLYEVKDGV